MAHANFDSSLNLGSQVGQNYGTINNEFHFSQAEAPNEGDKPRKDILKALQTSPYKDRKDRNPDHVRGTCEWFVDHSDFKHWRESKSSCMLWVSANPGCGKSVLAKHLVDCVLNTLESRTICYFFFKDDFEDQRSARSALSCILHQLLMQRGDDISNKVIKRLDSYRAPLAKSYYALSELWDVLVIASQDKSAGEIVCILDAFDECEANERQDFTNLLCEFYGPRNDMKEKVNLKFLITSRPYEDITRGIQPLRIPGLPVVHLEGESEAETEKIAREIDLYIEDRVSQIQIGLHLDSEEKLLLLQELRQVPNRTYLWVYLTLDWIETEIRNKINKEEIRRITHQLPRTVDDAYEKILARVKHPDEAKKMLHIVVAAAWPLTLAEMDLALALDQNYDSYEDRPYDRVYNYIRDLCGHFVTIINSKIYLLHQTAKEFLIPKFDSGFRAGGGYGQDSHRPKWKSSLRPQVSHRILCQICIWYLLFTEFETKPLGVGESPGDRIQEAEEVTTYLHDHVFLDYSAMNWAAHFRGSDIGVDIAVMDSLQLICNVDSKRCRTWFRVYWMRKRADFPRNFTTLMIASYFGLERLVGHQLRLDNVKINSVDGTYQRSALSWASENGFDGVVKLLISGTKFHLKWDIGKLRLPKGATIDATDRDGRTPLSYAVLNRHGSIIQRLVKAGARADREDTIGGTPISYALCTGQQDIAKQLMKGAQAGSMYVIRRDLLLSAAREGHEAVVKLLLDTGADVEAKDNYGETPLSQAATNGHEAMVRLLLDNGADVDAKDNYGRTPLWQAAANGHEAMVKRLLDNGADVDAKDNDSGTPLWQAAANGHEAVVKRLLDNGADVDAKDNYGRTPLWQAAANGHEAMVRLLLDNGADIDAKDNYGRTPLWQAAANGHQAVVQRLLEHGADVETKDNYGGTPLWQAAANGQEAVVKRLLDNGADVDAEDKYSGTPLWQAAANGQEAVVQRLLDNGADIEAKDNYGGTPLWQAAANGQEAVVQRLLEHGADIEAKDNYGGTPLWRAAGIGDGAVVKRLLDNGADVDAKDKYRGTPLGQAAANGHKAVVRLLLDNGADDHAKDSYGETPLGRAAENGHEAVVKLLLEHSADDVEAEDNYDGTPLGRSIMNGCKAVVKAAQQRRRRRRVERQLLQEDAGAVNYELVSSCSEAAARQRRDVKATDNYGETPLRQTTANEHEAVVKLLLEHGADMR